jgi:hypothetical protein
VESEGLPSRIIRSQSGRCKEKLEVIRSVFRLRHKQKVPNTSFSYPDKVRGVLNEGGLFGERQGWHLPSFSTSGWASRDLSEGLPNKAAGVGFFVSTFKLDIPKGLDVMLSFTFEEPLGQPYRAFLFVNGWMMGKRVANLGLVLFIHILVAFFH